MFEKFYKEKKIDRFLSFKEFENLKVFKATRGKTFVIDKLYFIISGTIEVFVTNDTDNSIKVSNVDNNNYLIGPIKNSKYKGMSLYYRGLTDITLVEISNELFNKLNTNIDFLIESRDIIFRRTMEMNYAFLIRSTYSALNNLRYSLELMCDDNMSVYIYDLPVFLEDNNISESSFYRSIKTLEKEGEITKIGNLIKFSEYKFRNDI